MAYFNQEMKKTIAPKINSLLKEYGMKGSLSVKNHSAVVLTLSKGALDFDREYAQINTYYVNDNYKDNAREFLTKAVAILNAGNYDNSDSQTDYFDVGYYVRIEIGRDYSRPYELITG